jgi:proline iminopeptidase
MTERRVFFDVVRGRARGGRTILAIHGGPGFTHRTLRPWLDPLTGPHAVVYLDLPGCGASSRHPGSGYPLEGYVADLEGVRSELGAYRIVPLGHGWGAILAVEYALAHPARVDRLVLVNPLRILRAEGQDHEAQARMIAAVDPEVTTPYVERLWPAIQRALAGDLDAWAAIDADPWWTRMWRTQFVTPPPPKWQGAVAGLALGMESYFAHKGAAMMIPDHPLAAHDLAERARRVLAPTLVIASDSDANYVASRRLHADPVHEALPTSELILLPDAGHFPFVDAQARFTAAVLRFLEG